MSVINTIALLSLALFFLYTYYGKVNPDVVYVDNIKVFSSFNMSKDLDRTHQKNLQKQKKTVDSIIAILQDSDKNNPNDELQRRFVFENNKLKEMGEYFTNNVSQQVWSRINSYIEEYGTQNNYTLIMGTQGNGNIMYAQKELDVTQNFIEFANKKYEGE
ncbi:hypothetical protein AEQU3_02244 [Aequorivita antarctica]|nr:hypothetical protein AEQU3_02244 [Aequorivita antarctica]